MFKKSVLIRFLLAMCLFCCCSVYAKEIDYRGCSTCQEAIAKETLEINSVQKEDHDELSQLYVSRGESFLLSKQYKKAIKDFRKAHFHCNRSKDRKASQIVTFRVALCSVVCFDNLGMAEATHKSLELLRSTVEKTFCEHCKKDKPCPSKLRSVINNSRHLSMMAYRGQGNSSQDGRKKDDYSDIQGPNDPLTDNWCEEVVVGTGRAMDAIAALAPNYGVKVALIGIIEALIARGVKCCSTGNFWKACVAPIARKWKEWDDLSKKSVFPNEPNLVYYRGTH